MPADDFDTLFAAHAKIHTMTAAISYAAVTLLRETVGDVYGPPHPYEPLQRFREAVRVAFEEWQAAPPAPAPILRIVK